MTKHRSPAEFDQPTPTCRVAEMARRFGVAATFWDRLEGDSERTNEMIMGALRDAAAFDQPTSPLGALFQVMIAASAMDSLHSHVADNAADVAREHAVRLECSLWGVRRFLEAHFGISAESISAYLMPRNVSCLGKLDAAMAAASDAGPRLHVAN